MSGSEDRTVKLWDAQTGGAIKTFSGHGSAVSSVSISPDRITIASGSRDGTTHLWDVHAGKCLHVVTCHDSEVTAIMFRPVESRRLISSSVDGTVLQWDVGESQIGSSYPNMATVAHVTYSSDGTRFILCGGSVATVRDSESCVKVAELHVAKRTFRCGCFSPNGRFVACAVDNAVYVWDITGPNPRLVGNLVGHTKDVISIVFSSSLISVSRDRSVKFWQIGTSPMLTVPNSTDDKPAPLAPVAIESINLFVEDDTAVTTDSSGVVKAWDITTGRCKSSFSTPAKGIRDTHLSNGTLIVAWYEWRQSGEGRYNIWDAEKGQLLRIAGGAQSEPSDLRISGDGSKVFVLTNQSIHARSTQTGKVVGRVRSESDPGWLEEKGPLIVQGSKVWLAQKHMGWDFGGQEAPVPLSGESPDRPRLDFIDRSTRNDIRPAWVQDTVTGDLIFRLSERYMKPSTKTLWDGRYLVVGCPSGEVVIMDFSHPYPR